jgi:hypothetical protein
MAGANGFKVKNRTLEQWFSKWGTWTGSNLSPENLLEIEFSCPTSDLLNQKGSGGICVVTSAPGDLDVSSSLTATALKMR